MLTKRQKEILDFIKEYIDKNEYSPSIEEIKEHFKLKSVSTIHEHIESLKSKGYLKKIDNQARTIQLLKKDNAFEIPIVGVITAGQPIEAIEVKNDMITITSSEIKGSKNIYALRVSGNSMIDEGIFDNDIVVIKKQSVAENGQTVVAIIDNNQATLKKIYREKNRFRLQPANQTMLPFYRKEVEIKGVVFQIIRDLEKSSTSFKTLDLFAGIGGIRLGFKKAGFETVFANDFEKACKNTYDLNFKTSKLVVEDIRNVGIDDLPKFDFLLAGFPCQSFSIAGYRKGFEDKERGNLFFEILKILRAKKPMGFLLENVKNLKGHDNGKTFKIIQDSLEDLGYHIKIKVLNSMEYGNVPQNRERIYIVGFKNINHYKGFRFPEKVKLNTKITDILEKKVDKKYYYNGKPLYERIKDDIKKEGIVYQWRRKYVRENKKGVCPTLTANMGMGGHNVPIIKTKKGIRKLTPFECARIQGFPKNYKLPKNLSDSALYKQLGNSVTVTVIEALAKQMMKTLQF